MTPNDDSGSGGVIGHSRNLRAPPAVRTSASLGLARLLTMLRCGTLHSAACCLSHNNQMITAARILFNFGQMLPFLN